MEVYRLCNKKEVDKIMESKCFDNVGALGKVYIKKGDEVDLNTHHYAADRYYMHFFPSFDSLFYLSIEKNMCICYYDIPDKILDKSVGYGEYKDYFSLSIPRKVLEYAVDIADLKYDYLMKVDFVKEDIPLEEYFLDESLSNFLETIYHTDKEINLGNKK